MVTTTKESRNSKNSPPSPARYRTQIPLKIQIHLEINTELKIFNAHANELFTNTDPIYAKYSVSFCLKFQGEKAQQTAYLRF